MAMNYWYQRRGMTARSRESMRTDQPPDNSVAASNYAQYRAVPWRANPLVMKNPMNIRIRAYAKQRITVVNLSNRTIKVRRIRSVAKRHLESQLDATGTQVTTAGMPTTPVLYAVGDELAQTDRGDLHEQTPAGTIGVNWWDPDLSGYYVTGNYNQFNFVATDPATAAAYNFLTGVRLAHAQDQFMPWPHPMRMVNAWQAGSDNFNDAFGATGIPGLTSQTWQPVNGGTTRPGFLSTAPFPGGSAPDPAVMATYIPNNYWQPSDIKTIDNVINGSVAPTNTGDKAWLPQELYNEGTAATSTAWTQYTRTPVPASALQFNAYYKEHHKGILDRYFKRRSYVKTLRPGQRMRFSETDILQIAPVRMGLYGYVGGDAPEIQNIAATKWKANNRWRTSAVPAITNPFGSVGLGFSKATSGLAGPPLLNATAATVSQVYEYPRKMYCKKTDPFGSPGTTKVNTLSFTSAPQVIAPGGATYNMNPTTAVYIFQTMFWKTKMYEKRSDPARRRVPFTVQNDQALPATSSAYVFANEVRAPTGVTASATA